METDSSGGVRNSETLQHGQRSVPGPAKPSGIESSDKPLFVVSDW